MPASWPKPSPPGVRGATRRTPARPSSVALRAVGPGPAACARAAPGARGCCPVASPSRAEYRVMLREDNADLRLTEAGRKLGLVDDARWDAFSRKRDAIARETQRLKAARSGQHSQYDLLRRPDMSYDSLTPNSTTDVA